MSKFMTGDVHVVQMIKQFPNKSGIPIGRIGSVAMADANDLYTALNELVVGQATKRAARKALLKKNA